MTRRSKEPEQTPDRSKIEVFYAKAEGTTQSLQDLMRALTSAIGRPLDVQVSRKLLQNNSPAAPAKTAPPEPTLFDEDGARVTDEGVSNGEAPTESSSPTPRRKRGEGAKRDRNAGLSIVKSLNLRPQGKDSLKEFVAAKKPQKQIEHIAVYVYYLRRILDEANVGFSHLFTCFKEVGERVPEDLPQTCRNVASQKGWIDTSNQDELKITTRGENFVEHELATVDRSESDGTK